MSDPRTILVTGGAGFIGSHLVRRLIGEGHRVRVFDNLATGRASNLEDVPGVELIEGDIRSRGALRAAMLGADAVFHVAGLPSVARSWSDPVTTLAVNAHGTANVVEAALDAKVECLVYSSSSSVYGEQEAELKDETLEPNPISPYAYSKFLGERIALAHAREGAMRVVALRYFNVFGPRQDPDSPYAAVVPLFIRAALTGATATVFGDGLQSRDFTYVDNVVDANVCALASEASGLAMNVATGQSHTIRELIDVIGRQAGRALAVTYASPRPGDIKHSRADVSLAEKAIGYRPRVGFEEGLQRTVEHYRSA